MNTITIDLDQLTAAELTMINIMPNVDTKNRLNAGKALIANCGTEIASEMIWAARVDFEVLSTIDFFGVQ